MKPIKTAVVGFGLSGEFFHAPIIQAVAELELSAVLSSKVEKVGQYYPDTRVFDDLERLLADESIELVVITTPNQLHYPMARACLEAGKHVVVEKPFVIESCQGEALIALARQQKCCLSVYHNRRFDGDFLTICRLLESGKLGQIHSFNASFNRYRPQVRSRWRESDILGAGLLFDLGSHLIDQALLLFGQPDSVTAFVHRIRPGAQSDDHFHLLLSYPSMEVTLHADCLSVDAGPRYQIAGAQGSFVKHGIDPQEFQLRSGMTPDSSGWGAEAAEDYGLLSLAEGDQVHRRRIATMNGCYQNYYRQMAAAIHHQGGLPVPPEQGLAVIRLIEDAFESARRGQTIKTAER